MCKLILFSALCVLSFSGFASVPWPVSDASASSVCFTICDSSSWSIHSASGGPSLLSGSGSSPLSVWLLIPSGDYVFSGSTNWTFNVPSSHTLFVGSDSVGRPLVYDDDSRGRQLARLNMTIYGFSTYVCFWLGGLMLRMLPRAANYGDV